MGGHGPLRAPGQRPRPELVRGAQRTRRRVRHDHRRRRHQRVRLRRARQQGARIEVLDHRQTGPHRRQLLRLHQQARLQGVPVRSPPVSHQV